MNHDTARYAPINPARGEAHWRARLTDATVREMRAVYERWKAAGVCKGYRWLGHIYSVSPYTARDIVTYRTRIDA